MKHSRHQRKALVLVAVLVVIVVLSLASYQYSDFMTSEYRATDSTIRDLQARAFAASGVHFAAGVIADAANAGNLFDNRELFDGQIVLEGDGPGSTGRFSIVAPMGPSGGDAQAFRFGAVDEGGKINLNALLRIDKGGKTAHAMLMKLPNMTTDIANAILDWIDSDATPRTGGAENETYSSLDPAYRAKNGPLDSIDELLLVRGITPDLLYGGDANRNGIIDGSETTTQQGTGWSAYLTVYSREQNLDFDGQPRINLNEKDLTSLYDKLSPAVGDDLAKFIVLARQYGVSSTKSDSSQSSSGGRSRGGGNRGGNSKGSSGGNGGGSLRGMSRGSLNIGKGGSTKSSRISSLYDLVDAQVSVPSEEKDGEPTVYASPLNDAAGLRQQLPVLLDKTTTSNQTEMPARISVNTAPETVLRALPELTPSQAEAIIAARPQTENSDQDLYRTQAWLLADAKIPAATMKKLEKYVTASSQVYRVQSVGHFDQGGPIVRIEAVIDGNAGRPRIVYWRDLSELGKGYDVTNVP